LILVPTMLKRLLDEDTLKQRKYDQLSSIEAKDATHNLTLYHSTFCSVKRIISGGAKLDANLATQTLAHTGDTLFNLYGTSESGFGVMATPADLHRYPDSVGKTIKGVRLKVLPIEANSSTANQTRSADDAIGVLSLGTAWSMDNNAITHTAENISETNYISTGDLVSCNVEGYLFLKGRADDMIVSGGENVYPLDIENALRQHTHIGQVAVIAIDHNEFGKRLVAFVGLVDSNVFSRNSESITALQLMQWLKPKLARYQMPQQIVLMDELPITKTGKVSHAKLKEWFYSESIR
ncbi:class I adenylate-forming enzyme family protein, partial [Psychrobacter sp.]